MASVSVLRAFACCAVMLTLSCSSSDYDFSATHRFGTIEVTIGLKSVSVFAEYKRFAIIRFAGRDSSVIELFEDTGGYSSVDVEQDSCCIFLRTPPGNDAVRIDATEATLQIVPAASIRADAKSLGQFNFEEKSGGEYRYFPANR